MSQPYVILARKYRPQHFDEVVGQDAIVTTLSQGLKTGRLAQAWLMCGPSGVGKTTLARILARCLNCTEQEQPTPTPCGKCPSCQGILNGDSMDLLEIDGASNNRVDEVRQLQEHIGFRPQYSRYRIVLIDEVHMLSTAAFNALLKTLEEPPEHVKFIFATTEPERVLPTVRARCQRFDFFSVSPSDLASHVTEVAGKEKITLEDGAAMALAKLAGGSVRNSLSLLDQLGNDGQVTLEKLRQLSGQALPEHVQQLCHLVWEGSPRAAIQLIDKLDVEAIDLKILVEQWSVMLRQALEQKIDAIEHGLMLPSNVTVSSLIYQGKFVLNLLKDLHREPSPKMAVILTVAKLCSQEDLRPLADLIEKLPPTVDGPSSYQEPILSVPVPPGPMTEVYRSPDPVEEEMEIPKPAEVPPSGKKATAKAVVVAGALSMESLRNALVESGNRAASSFMDGGQLDIQGSMVTIEVSKPFFRGVLDTPANRAAITAVLEPQVPGLQLKIECKEAVVKRNEEAEMAKDTPAIPNAEAMEKKVIDMFDGEKLS